MNLSQGENDRDRELQACVDQEVIARSQEHIQNALRFGDLSLSEHLRTILRDPAVVQTQQNLDPDLLDILLEYTGVRSAH